MHLRRGPRGAPRGDLQSGSLRAYGSERELLDATDPGDVLVSVGCTDDGAAPPGDRVVLQPTGSDVTVGRVHLVGPQGAEAGPTEVYVLRSEGTVPGFNVRSEVWSFEPTGLVLRVPITVGVMSAAHP
jgi:hypothetical protein